jgi:hypothetical protein
MDSQEEWEKYISLVKNYTKPTDRMEKNMEEFLESSEGLEIISFEDFMKEIRNEENESSDETA